MSGYGLGRKLSRHFNLLFQQSSDTEENHESPVLSVIRMGLELGICSRHRYTNSEPEVVSFRGFPQFHHANAGVVP
jgi:hypothetical protein